VKTWSPDAAALVLRPCAASVVVFSLAGAVLAVAFWPGPGGKSWITPAHPASFFCVPAVVSFPMWLAFCSMRALRLETHWRPFLEPLKVLFAWWAVYYIVFCTWNACIRGFMWLTARLRGSRKHGGQRAQSVALLPSGFFVIVSLVCVGRPRAEAWYQKEGDIPSPGHWFGELLHWAVNTAIVAPDLVPPHLWKETEERLPNRHWPPVLSAFGSTVAQRIGCGEPIPAPSAPWFIEVPGQPDRSRIAVRNSRLLCSQLQNGLASPMFRSSFILMGFGLGLAFAGLYERRRRFTGYDHRLRTKDQRAALAIVILQAIIILAVRTSSG
jgi:hypothetical protein